MKILYTILGGLSVILFWLSGYFLLIFLGVYEPIGAMFAILLGIATSIFIFTKVLK